MQIVHIHNGSIYLPAMRLLLKSIANSVSVCTLQQSLALSYISHQTPSALYSLAMPKCANSSCGREMLIPPPSQSLLFADLTYVNAIVRRKVPRCKWCDFVKMNERCKDAENMVPDGTHTMKSFQQKNQLVYEVVRAKYVHGQISYPLQDVTAARLKLYKIFETALDDFLGIWGDMDLGMYSTQQN